MLMSEFERHGIPWVKPMNAKSVPDKPGKLESLLESPRYVAQQKLDGIRELCNILGDGVPNLFISRVPSVEGGPTDNADVLPHLRDFHEWGQPITGLTILDGELVPGGKSLSGKILRHEVPIKSSEVIKVTGSLPGRAVDFQEQNGYCEFWVFDILYFQGKSLLHEPLEKRLEILSAFMAGVNSPFIKQVPVVYGKEAKEALLASELAAGREGIVLKNLDAAYYPDKRPANVWFKVKAEKEFDVVIMGFIPAVREYTGKFPTREEWPYWEGDTPVTRWYAKGWIGSVVFGQYKDGELVEVGQTSGMNDATREMFSKNPEAFIGKVMKVECMERIEESGALRHPRFSMLRPDKSPEMCIWGEC